MIYMYGGSNFVSIQFSSMLAIQPGGSVRDEDVISAANERDMAMVFTKARHFKH